MHRLRVPIVLFVLGACDTSQPPQQAPPAPAAPSVPPPPEFRFRPTVEANTPPGSVIEPIAEAGDVAKGRLLLVVAHHDGTSLSVDGWTFNSTGEDETLVPSGPPVALLALAAGEQTNTATLDEFVRTRAAGHSPSSRPQGIDAPDAATALERLHKEATLALDTSASPERRVAALATFTRGLDDALLFSSRGLTDVLRILGAQATASGTTGSARRATTQWGDTKISMLRKADGWTIDALP